MAQAKVTTSAATVTADVAETAATARTAATTGTVAGTARGRVRRFATRALVVVLASALVPVAFLWAVQDRFVYAPSAAVPPVASVLPGAEEVTYAADDGTMLAGWFVPARGTPTGITVVAFHGYVGDRAAMAPDAATLSGHGIAVLLAEYRGYGGLEGTPTEDGLRGDALAAASYVRHRPDVDPTRVAYLGYSLGTGVAVEAAQVAPPAALVLLAPYTSLPDIAWSRLPALPYRLLMRSQFDTRSRIAEVRVPLLVVRGSDDHTVPPGQSQEVFDTAGQPKQLVTIAGADHDLRGPTGPPLDETVRTFLVTTVATT